MTDQELLKEARDALGVVTAYIENGTPLPPDDDPYWKASTAVVNLESILSRIDSALAAPEPDAMELVRQVREGSVAGYTLSSNYWKLTDSEAAALIEQYAKRVPRALLEETYSDGFEAAFGTKMIDRHDTRAAKYGYKVEDKDE